MAHTPKPLLKYTIYSSNVTWGEDLSGHISRQYNQLIVRDTLSLLNQILDKIARGPTIPMVVTIYISIMVFWGYLNLVTNSWLEMAQLMTDQIGKIKGGPLEIINVKLDILLNSSVQMFERHWGIEKVISGIWLSFVVAGLAIVGIWKAIRKHTRCYIVAFNEVTTTRLQRMIKGREYVLWAVLVAFGIGVMASVAAAHVDKLFFG
jgi:hypothetical protein